MVRVKRQIMKHLDYIKLEKIRQVFKEYFENFSIELPSIVKPWDDWRHEDSGWSITYSLGYDDENIPCMFIAANHRMTNPRHFLINENGEIKSLDQYHEMVSYNPNIEGDEEIRSQEFYKHNRKISSLYRLEGISSNFEFNTSCANENLTDFKEFFFFWETESPFSQWHKCSFKAFGIEFSTAEQYIMFQKALLFNDYGFADKILDTTNQRKQKELGSQVAKFDEKIWNNNCRRIAYEANKHKFMQNDSLLKYLLGTDNKLLVEASPDDFIWGIGLKKEDKLAQNANTWKGKNWLGYILTLLKDDIKKTMDK
jgi:ribA/ribD-fused uncharacterized protein